MKKKYIAITLGIVLSVGSLAVGCSSASSTSASSEAATSTTANAQGSDAAATISDTASTDTSQYAGQTITGEITAVDSESVTISQDDSDEELKLAVDDNVTITSGGMPGGGMPGGAPGSNGSSQDSSSGETGSNQSSDTSGGNNGEQPPEKPDGDSGEEPPAKPDGDNGEEPPEKPDGDNGEEPPAKPGEGQDQADSTADENTDNTGEDNNSGEDSGSGDSAEGTDTAADGTTGANQNTGTAQGTGTAQEGSGTDSTDGSAGQSVPGGQGGAPQEEEITIDDLQVGDQVSVTFDDDGKVTKISVGGGDMGGAPGGQQSSVESYDANTEYTEDTSVSDETIDSTGTDENAVHAYNGANVTLSDMTISRDSEDSQGGDNSSFYGVGAAVLDTDGTTYLSDSTITTDAKGGAGVFAYGSGTIYVADSVINTSQDTSGGIHAAGGGTLYAWDLDVTTGGESSAAIRSDRGGGTMVVDGGTYTSNGSGSPAIYSTADIAVNNATLTANGSEAICIEGSNSIHLFDSDLTGNMSDLDQNGLTWNVILYQSMSGDSEEGNSTFEMNGGSLTAENGGMFYTTNTESTFILDDVDITYADDSEFFLRCTGNSNERGWGTAGANGADCNFTAIDQEMQGDVQWDSISKLEFYMTDGSTLTGAFVDDETDAGDGGDGYANLYISDDSTWVVTGDSTLTNLYSEGTIVDEDGNTVSIVGSDGTTYVEGDSQYTVTVESYSDTADLSGAAQAADWSSYEVERPEELGTASDTDTSDTSDTSASTTAESEAADGTN